LRPVRQDVFAWSTRVNRWADGVSLARAVVLGLALCAADIGCSADERAEGQAVTPSELLDQLVSDGVPLEDERLLWFEVSQEPRPVRAMYANIVEGGPLFVDVHPDAVSAANAAASDLDGLPAAAVLQCGPILVAFRGDDDDQRDVDVALYAEVVVQSLEARHGPCGV
jgi:hypothetical protein